MGLESGPDVADCGGAELDRRSFFGWHISTTMASSKHEERQYLWIVRHGLTKYPLTNGPVDGELDLLDGMEQTKMVAARVSADRSKAPTAVYSSPFLRTVHTAQLIALELRQPCVRIEEGLTEWRTPALWHDSSGNLCETNSSEALAQRFGTIDLDYASLNPAASEEQTESTEDLSVRCATTVERLLEYHGRGENLCLVSHAPCNQAMARHLGDAAAPSNTEWPMGGVALFARTIYEDGSTGSWEMEIGTHHHPPLTYRRMSFDALKDRRPLPTPSVG